LDGRAARRAQEGNAEGRGSENFFLRVEDVPAALERLERWNREVAHVLNGRRDLERLGMSGHSFGAITT
jgi:hypothetical protein